MNTTPEHNERIAKMTFASVYPLYLAKVERKGRAKEELHQVITWLTGFDEKILHQLIDEKVTFFFTFHIIFYFANINSLCFAFQKNVN